MCDGEGYFSSPAVGARPRTLLYTRKPFPPRDRERLSRRFSVDFNYNSNHVEGNTLTYGQTEILLLFGKVVGEADVLDVHKMTASNVGLEKKYVGCGEKDGSWRVFVTQ